MPVVQSLGDVFWNAAWIFSALLAFCCCCCCCCCSCCCCCCCCCCGDVKMNAFCHFCKAWLLTFWWYSFGISFNIDAVLKLSCPEKLDQGGNLWWWLKDSPRTPWTCTDLDCLDLKALPMKNQHANPGSITLMLFKWVCPYVRNFSIFLRVPPLVDEGKGLSSRVVWSKNFQSFHGSDTSEEISAIQKYWASSIIWSLFGDLGYLEISCSFRGFLGSFTIQVSWCQ